MSPDPVSFFHWTPWFTRASATWQPEARRVVHWHGSKCTEGREDCEHASAMAAGVGASGVNLKTKSAESQTRLVKVSSARRSKCTLVSVSIHTQPHTHSLGLPPRCVVIGRIKCGGLHSQQDKHLTLFLPAGHRPLKCSQDFLHQGSACVLVLAWEKLNNALDYWYGIYRSEGFNFLNKDGHQCCTSYSISSSTHAHVITYFLKRFPQWICALTLSTPLEPWPKCHLSCLI